MLLKAYKSQETINEQNKKNLIAKKNKSKIVSLTAYSKNIASVLDNYCDLIFGRGLTWFCTL